MNLQERLIQIVSNRTTALKKAALDQRDKKAETPSPEMVTFQKIKEEVVRIVTLAHKKFLEADTNDLVLIDIDEKRPHYFKVLIFTKTHPIQTWINSAPGITVSFYKTSSTLKITYQSWFDPLETTEEFFPINKLPENYFETMFVKILTKVLDKDFEEEMKKLKATKELVG